MATNVLLRRTEGGTNTMSVEEGLRKGRGRRIDHENKLYFGTTISCHGFKLWSCKLRDARGSLVDGRRRKGTPWPSQASP